LKLAFRQNLFNHARYAVLGEFAVWINFLSFEIPCEAGTDLIFLLQIFGVAQCADKIRGLCRQVRAQVIEFAIVWKFLVSLFCCFPRDCLIAPLADFRRFDDIAFYGLHICKYFRQLPLAGREQSGRRYEARFIIENLAVVMLAD
jgi:hypothetical protein